MSDNTNAIVEIAEEAIKKLESLVVSDNKDNKDDGDKREHKKRLPTSERIRLWEEEQRNKVVILSGLKGTVKWYSVLGRYGFISREDGEKDVFVHQTAIAKSITNKFYLRTLADNEEVLFDLVEGKKGPEAANVTGPNGENVLGSRRRHWLLSRFRKNIPKRSTDEENSKTEKSSEESKKPRKQRKNRSRKQRKDQASGDAPEEVAAGVRRKVIDDEVEKETITSDRCGSALGEAALGAQQVDAQI